MLCGMGILDPQPGIEPVDPALGAQTLNYWTIRKVPPFDILDISDFPPALRSH